MKKKYFVPEIGIRSFEHSIVYTLSGFDDGRGIIGKDTIKNTGVTADNYSNAIEVMKFN